MLSSSTSMFVRTLSSYFGKYHIDLTIKDITAGIIVSLTTNASNLGGSSTLNSLLITFPA